MKVTIKTLFGKITFDLAKNRVLDLIQKAAEYAAEDEEAVEAEEAKEEPAPKEPAIPLGGLPKQNMINPDAEPVAEKKTPVHGSRAEAMFGRKEDWDMPVMVEDKEELRTTYSGFIWARCEACGKEKGFCAKVPISFHKCECGHKTLLKKMRPAVVHCECGKEFRYKTNVQDKVFTIPCLSCGSPVDLELNKDWTAYRTIE